MKQIFTRIISLLFIFFPCLLFAQEKKDYTILLNSGKFVPAGNVNSLSKNDAVFHNSLFNNRHYVTIQFNELPNQVAKERMSSAGIRLLDYIPYNAYTASVPATVDPNTLRSFNVRSVFQFSAVQKTVPDILVNNVPAYAVKTPDFVDVDLLLYENLTADKITPSLNELGAIILADMPVFRIFTVRVPQNKLLELVAFPFVQWVEYISPPNVPENLPGRVSHRVNGLNDGVRNLKGDGMRIGVWDEVVSQHLDFSPSGRVINVDPGGGGSHGTHLSGTIGGRGLINPIARGMAPNAILYSYNGYDGGGSAFDNNLAQMAIVIPANTLIASNHSYHDGLGVQCVIGGAATAYTLRSRNVDINLNNNTFHLHCHSAGNAQGSCASGWFSITGTGKSAKNNVVVGALTSADNMTSYSSFGPVNDGRVKPEICAVGDAVFSTYTPLNAYGTISGTSMATPGIAGSLTLLAQRYKELNSNILPPSTLIKNVACNTAEDLGNPGPDYRFGFGRINALAAVKILEENRYVVADITTGNTTDLTISIPAGTVRLRVMLTWNDPAGAANASVPLVNNLDLRVLEGSNTYLPWILNPNSPASNATQADDNISNIEQVTINNPAPGTYTLRVIGEAVPTGPIQTYALTWDVEQPYIEITYPNGGESFNPGSNQNITWDNAGVTSTQTVQFSTNNGSSWTTISSSVAANTKRLVWSVPSGNTSSTALIKVFSGSLTDNSDGTFRILGTTTGLTGTGATCTAGQVIFNWTAVVDATHYDIYSLDPATGDFVILATDVTGTTYTASGLTPGNSMWFNIRSKNNTLGAVSERSNAINVTVSTGGGGLGTIGSISGQNIICGNPSAVPYTIPAVSGASNYTWTAPPGANITSGQGTTNININYAAGSSNGNVSVYASNGSCQTTTVTLAVTVGPSSVAAPASGGDQSATACPPNPIPTLTATATVPAGHTLVWYDAATGGSVVSSPTLNSVGTVTYYASSRHTTSGCESDTRTPVTLTITAVPPPTITVSGPTSFCQGGSVMLTANTGSSYTWSNGATSQAITVNSSGSFTVMVTQSGGCTGTSAPVTVTVNPVPTATITAGGPTSFCSGNNVVLTASSGSSWLWSNGATTQSITVANSGSFSVTVTNSSGCSALSSAVSTSVSPRPTVVITASPYTSLFPGLTTTLTANVTPPGTYTYVWFKNAVPITGATTATLTGIGLSDLGSYTVTVTNTTGLPCASTSTALTITDSVTKKLFIFPSPNSGQFNVSYHNSTGTTTYTLSIYDSKGSLVFTKAYPISSPYEYMAVDLRRNGKGVYNVVLTDKLGKRAATGRVVIQ